ncbi:MAG: hypothetical protein WCJ49_06690, partial [Deltaproteobacteria bacterium]
MIFFREFKSASKAMKKMTVVLSLWFFGRAIAAATRIDDGAMREFKNLPDNFSFTLEVMPHGPGMIVGKDKDGVVKYLGSKIADREVTLRLRIKNMSAAFAIFTLQEGNAIAAVRNRLVIEGDIAYACAAIRILEIVEVYLLPKFLAKLALKRYPVWNFGKKVSGRMLLY